MHFFHIHKRSYYFLIFSRGEKNNYIWVEIEHGMESFSPKDFFFIKL